MPTSPGASGITSCPIGTGSIKNRRRFFGSIGLALSLPLEPIRAVHFVGLIFAAATACALFFLARRFVSHTWSVIAAIVFALLLADPMINGLSANTELFMLLPLILSQLAFLSATENERHRLLLMIRCGAMTGLAAAFKQVAAINWPFLIAIFPLFVALEKRWRRTLEFATWSTFGAAGIWGIIALYFWSHHGLNDLVYNVFTHNLEYVRTISWWVRWQFCQMALKSLTPSQAIVWAMAILGLLGQLLVGPKRSFWFWLTALVVSAIGVSASGYFFAHYFQQVLPGPRRDRRARRELDLLDALARSIPFWLRNQSLLSLLSFCRSSGSGHF